MAFQLGAKLLDACVLAVLSREDTYGYILTQNVSKTQTKTYVQYTKEHYHYRGLYTQPNGNGTMVANYDGTNGYGTGNFVKKAYECAKRETEKMGVKIYNATRGGKLEVFDRVNFESLF